MHTLFLNEPLVHLHVAGPDPAAEEIKLHIGMLGEEGHGDSGVHDALGDHQSGQPLAERVVVVPGMPDGDLLSLPGLHWAYADGLGWDQGDVSTAGGASVLRDRQRV